MNLSELKTALVRILGPERVKDDPETLREMSVDRTESPPGRAEFVLYPETVAEIQAILGEASRHRVAVVPMVANTNLGGLAIPVQGGLVLNLTRMNRILEVNEQDLYAVIEPGVTWEQLSDHLEQRFPLLRFGYPLSPPDSGIVPNCLMDGLVNLSLRHGSASHWINALEAVLPCGEILRTGHSAFSPLACAQAPFPGLEGLFIGFQGTTGVVTRMAVQLWPARKHRRRWFIMAYEAPSAFRLVADLVREELLDDLGVLSWPTGKMMFGEYLPTFRDPGEPLMFLYLDVTSNFASEFRCKQEIVQEIIRAAQAQGKSLDGPLDVQDLVRIEPRFSKFAKFPTRLDFLLDHPGKGLTWIGTYGPVSRLTEGFERGSALMTRHGFPPTIVVRIMRGGHFAVLRFITIFDQRDPAEVARVRALQTELADLSVELGFFPYKTPQWVWERYRDRIDPTFRRLVGEVQKLMDPLGIMNPGHLDLSTPEK